MFMQERAITELRALYFKTAHRVWWHGSGEAALTVSAWTEELLQCKFSITIFPKRLYLKQSTTSFKTHFLHWKGEVFQCVQTDVQ